MTKLSNRSLQYLLIIALLVAFSSCRTSKSITQSKVTKDSTTTQTTQTKSEDFNTVKQGQTVIIRDSIRTEVVFKTDTITKTEVRFKDGKIVYVKGPVERITTTDTRAEDRADSLQTLTYILRDSLQTAQASVKTVEVIKEKEVKRGFPWFWVLLALIAGFLLGIWATIEYIKSLKKSSS